MRVIAIGTAALALTAGMAAADTIIDNGQFGANISTIGGANGSDIYGQSFIAPADNQIVQFGMWLQGGGGDAPLVSIDLWADDGSNNPDENNILIDGTDHQGDLVDLTRIDTFTSFTLTAGTRYWIVINGNVDQTSGGTYASTWDGQTNTIVDGNMTWSNDNGGSWSGGIPEGDFGVYAHFTPVPAPASAALLALGGLVATRRRR
jgi:hypothetical protein